MSHNDQYLRERLLPTYRLDKKRSAYEAGLMQHTMERVIDFTRTAQSDDPAAHLPPEEIMDPIVTMNLLKRSQATRRAELDIDAGLVDAPPLSLVPSFMMTGTPLTHLEDGYLTRNHPSQELFAHIRIGKRSWLNHVFTSHCLTALGLAYPTGTVTPDYADLRVKAHSAEKLFAHNDAMKDKVLENWRIISTKSRIATISDAGRKASLVSRVTGAVDLESPDLGQEEAKAIIELSEYDSLPHDETPRILGQKAILREALIEHDGNYSNPFYPVLQTIYLTQLSC